MKAILQVVKNSPPEEFQFFQLLLSGKCWNAPSYFLTQVAIQTKEPLSQTARKGCVCMLIIWWCIVGKGANESFCFEGNKSSYCSARCMSERVLWLSVCVCMRAIFNPNVLGICFLRVCVCMCVCVCAWGQSLNLMFLGMCFLDTIKVINFKLCMIILFNCTHSYQFQWCCLATKLAGHDAHTMKERQRWTHRQRQTAVPRTHLSIQPHQEQFELVVGRTATHPQL